MPNGTRSVMLACAINLLCSAAVLLLVNIGVLSVVQATLGLLFSLEGRNAVLRRSASRARRFLIWVFINVVISTLIAIGSVLHWYESHCDDKKELWDRHTCRVNSRKSGQKYAVVEMVWAAVGVVTALCVGRMLKKLPELKTQLAASPQPAQPAQPVEDAVTITRHHAFMMPSRSTAHTEEEHTT